MSHHPFFKEHPEYGKELLKEYNKRWMYRKRNEMKREGLVEEIVDEWKVTPPVITEEEEEEEEDYSKFLKKYCCSCKKRISNSNEWYKTNGNYCPDCTREAKVNAMSADQRNESKRLFSNIFKH